MRSRAASVPSRYRAAVSGLSCRALSSSSVSSSLRNVPRFNAASTSACSCARLAAAAPGRAGRAGVVASAGAGAGAGVAGGRPRAAGEGILSNRASGGAVACAVTAAERDGRGGFDAEPGGSLEGVNGALAAVPGRAAASGGSPRDSSRFRSPPIHARVPRRQTSVRQFFILCTQRKDAEC